MSFDWMAALSAVVLAGIVWTVVIGWQTGFSIWTILSAGVVTLAFIIANAIGESESNETPTEDGDYKY